MAETKIEWAHFSWSPWFGCTRVSEGCRNCYSESDNRRYKRNGTGGWGPGAPRVLSKGWDKPLTWNRRAAREGARFRVFPSLCDPFDAEVPDEWRERLMVLIEKTPSLDWLLLTKRPENVNDFLAGYYFPDNVWLGVSVENQKAADERIPLLLQIPAAVRFLSVEPLLGPIEFSDVSKRADAISQLGKKALTGVDWLIAGSESGPGARPAEVAWFRSLRDQCEAAEVPFFLKQFAERGKKIPLPFLDGRQHAEFPNEIRPATPANWDAYAKGDLA